MDALKELEWLKVETGSLACLGCGHEHGCAVHGCAILREAAEEIRQLRVIYQIFLGSAEENP